MSDGVMIFDKKTFMDTMDKTIKEDDVVVLTMVVEKMEVVKSKNKKRVQFAHAADTFKDPESVKDLMNNFNCAIVVGNKSIVNDNLKKQVEGGV